VMPQKRRRPMPRETPRETSGATSGEPPVEAPSETRRAMPAVISAEISGAITAAGREAGRGVGRKGQPECATCLRSSCDGRCGAYIMGCPSPHRGNGATPRPVAASRYGSRLDAVLAQQVVEGGATHADGQ
jgi:hypothetical protein